MDESFKHKKYDKHRCQRSRKRPQRQALSLLGDGKTAHDCDAKNQFQEYALGPRQVLHL
jgi:hypothetical protein